MDLALAGKRCVVTGGSKGIGAATAFALAAEGADVAIIARNEGMLRRRATEIEKAHGTRAIPITADLSTAAGVQSSIDTAQSELGGIDVLVNNAGASGFGSIEQVDDDAWKESFDLKLMGYVRGMRAVFPAMRAQRSGRIVNVLGIAGVSPSAGYVLGAFNAALAHVTRSAAAEVAADGILINAIHPGPTATDRILSGMAAGAESAGVDLENFLQQFATSTIPVGRMGTPEEVAKMIVVLASEVASYMTGGAIQVDGGIAKGLL